VGIELPPPKPGASGMLTVRIDGKRVLLDGAEVSTVSPEANDAQTEWKIVGLYEALVARKAQTDDHGVILLDAARRTDAAMITRVMKTCDAAGFPNVMFATPRQ
jgi:hypothetical protein